MEPEKNRPDEAGKAGEKPRKRRFFHGAASERTLLRTLIGVALSGVLLSGAVISFAWFSQNVVSQGSGMDTLMQAGSDLLISDDEGAISTPGFGISSASPFIVIGGNDDNKYYPAQHASDYTTYPSGLKSISNPGAVSLSTGVGTSLIYVPANNPAEGSRGKIYYKDCVVYIASSKEAMTDTSLRVGKLTVTETVDGKQVAVTSGTPMALSVDVYEGTTLSADTYKGTLNAAGLDASVNDYPGTYDSAATKDGIDLFGGTEPVGTIPKNTDGYLTYTLRCYFDGALLSGDGQCYVATQNLNLSKITLSVSFYTDTD